MKKTKLLVPLLTITGLSATIAPIITMTSCSCGNEPKVIDYKVTEEEWKAAINTLDTFNNDKANFTNVISDGTKTTTFKVAGKNRIKTTIETGKEDVIQYFTMKYGREFLLKTNSSLSGKYYYVTDYDSNDFAENSELLNLYSSFTLDETTNTYGWIYQPMPGIDWYMSYDLKFENKKLTSCKIHQYGSQATELTYTFTFNNYGSTTIQNFIADDNIINNFNEATNKICTFKNDISVPTQICVFPLSELQTTHKVTLKDNSTALSYKYLTIDGTWLSTLNSSECYTKFESAGLTWNNENEVSFPNSVLELVEGEYLFVSFGLDTEKYTKQGDITVEFASV